MSQESTVLIVDDEPAGREALAGLLYAQGYRLLFAANGAEAIACASAEQPDLVLLDVMMPEMDGFAVCRHLRDDPALAEVPIVLVTALDDHESRLQGITAGADDFIAKPYNRTELRARVRTITRLNRYRRLVEQRSTFEWVVDRAEEGYLIVDAAGHIRYANAVARRFLGAPNAGDIDASFMDLASRQYHSAPPVSWDGWLPQPGQEAPERRILVRPASDISDVFMLQVDTRAMKAEPAGHFLLQLRDITGGVLEQQSIWSFQAVIRHKLYTTLSQLSGALSMIEYLQLSPASPATTDLFQIALNGAKGLKANVEDIFQFLDTKELTHPEQGWCCLAELPSLVAESCARANLPPAQVQLAGFAHPAEERLAISRQGLALIIDELIENARKFHPTQHPTIEVAAERAGDMLRIDMRDDGVSLSPEQLARAQQPYFQGERYFTGQTAGMGLGLAVVAALMWRVGGSSQIYNCQPAPGVGIELRIPIAAVGA